MPEHANEPQNAKDESVVSSRYTIGLDYGTNSVRALLVDVADGEEIAHSVHVYDHGEAGVVLDERDPNLARQYPADYLASATITVRDVLALARQRRPDFQADQVAGIGVDTTGSTPMPVDAQGRPLTERPEFKNNPNAYAWLWKDHTAHAEAEEITRLAETMRPDYLAKCGGRYSSEWFWSKVLRAARVAPEVFDAAATWVEIADWIPAVLTGNVSVSAITRGVCAAGHKAMYHPAWGGYPDIEFLAALDPRLVRVRESLPAVCATVAESVGGLSAEWADRFGLPTGIPVAVGAFDAHLGAVGSGIGPGTLVKIIGTSTCDMMVSDMHHELPDIPGLCGIVPESILPGAYGLEAGQSAVGDIFGWFVDVIKPANETHESLTRKAARMKPGESGLMALDWHNGNRTVLVDQRLTGLIVGLTLQTTPAEIYRALVESTAFGARAIVERLEEYGVRVDRVVNCGGIAVKNAMVMQIYADVMNRPMLISRSDLTCALGAAMAASVVAGLHADFAEAASAMTGVRDTVYTPIPENVALYERLYKTYRALHDGFGLPEGGARLYDVMKGLLAVRDEVRQ